MLIFIDESGKPHPNDSTTNPVLCGVCIKESDIKIITKSIYRLKMKIFGKDTEVKSTSLIRRRIFDKNMTINKQYVEEFVKTACSLDIRVFAIIMDKPNVPVILNESILPKPYKLLISRVERYCDNYGHEKAILVFDEDPGNDLIVAKCITNFLFRSKIGKRFDYILEMPFFVSSKVTPAIQIADVFAGIIRHYYEIGLFKKASDEISDRFECWINELFMQIISKTENLKQKSTGFIEYGFYNMGKKF
jgi:hypothetical protein